LFNQSADSVDAAPTRYGGIVDNTLALKSMHIQATSERGSWIPPIVQYGADHSAGHPDQGIGTIGGSWPAPGSGPSIVTPCGSPGTADGGPTVPGTDCAGVFGFGGIGSDAVGRIALVNQLIASRTSLDQ
jgi:hypothetical protein